MADKSLIGKIHSVACKDFVTYNNVVFYPGDELNLIIGPNGTGKSTLVAAIILGMGGAPKLLSRSTRIEEYIKNGKAEAWIEIKIYKNTNRKTISFERLINMEGKSKWKVDGTASTIKDYLATVSKYNIQINNLCQFLPQDRVQDFAKMNAREILLSTMNSVCSPDILQQFEQLKEIRHEQLQSKTELKTNLEKLKICEENNAILKMQVDTMNVRTRLKKDIQICIIKQKWLKYLEEKENANKIRIELSQANVIVKNHQKHLNDLKKDSQLVITESENYKRILHSEEETRQTLTNKFDELNQKCEQLESSIRTAETELQSHINEQEEKFVILENEKKILEGILQDLKNAIAACSPDDEQNANKLNEKIENLKVNIKLLIDNHRVLNRQIDELTPETQVHQRKINRLRNVDEVKLNMLRDNFENVYQGVLWLRENQHLFEGKIYEPIILEINVDDSSYAKYIENIVSIRDLLAFTCENKSDMNTLISHLCNEKGLQINAIHSDPSEQCQFSAIDDINKYKKFGFFSYLIDMIQGPAPILNYLCKAYSLHQILAGNDSVSNYIDALPKHIRRFFCGNHLYSISISKYSGQKASKRDEITDRNLLSIGINMAELKSLEGKLRLCLAKSDKFKNDRSKVESQLSNLEQQRNSILEEKKIFEKKKILVRQKKEQIIMQKDKIERLQQSEINIEEKEENFKKFAQEIVSKHFKLQIEKVNCLKESAQSYENYEFTRLKFNIYKKENADLEEKVRNAKSALTNGEQLLETILAKHNQLNSKVQKYLNDVESLCDGNNPDSENFIYKKNFDKLSNDLNELNDIICKKQSQVNCMVKENQSILEKYTEQCETIENLKEFIKNGTDSDKNINDQITEIYNRWYPEIMRIIDIINTNFGKFMTSMQYVGEIVLGRQGYFDFDTYGIEIFVQYRNNTKLQALDRFVQSGGERAVAIAVYTLSIQHISNVPFRCVDEINQGMDARNERKIFEMLVNETAKPKQSQYFFITPKLLPDLPYNDYMTVHIVYNGHFIKNSNVFNADQIEQ